MRNEKMIKKFMAKHDLNFDEAFIIIDKAEPTYKIEGMFKKVGKEIQYFESVEDLTNGFEFDYDYTHIGAVIFSPDVQIVKKVVHNVDVPSKGTRYFYIDINGEIRSEEWDCYFFDINVLMLGNCFKTREEAEENREKVMNMYRNFMTKYNIKEE